ncbi:unnamed protein product [Rotaria sordida]|uniref:SSD domain-containing protein n=1 Tax=Rotaria sordida TaxID=392033 RepID=A0A819ACI6_9BILA|nr:unnamed protein product [Rotaria sordida]
MATLNNSSMKQTNRIKTRMNSIRQMSNSKWKQFSHIYSKFLIRFSWSIFSISLLITVGLLVCFFLLMEIRAFDQNDFIMQNGLTMKNAIRLRKIFGNDTEFRIHQQLNLYPALDIIIKRKLDINATSDNSTNMLNETIIAEMLNLDKRIQSVQINDKNKSVKYNYSSLCTKINHACIIDGNYILSDKFREDMSNLIPPKNGYYVDALGANGIPEFMFGKNYYLTDALPIVPDYQEDEEEEEEKQEQDHGSNKIISYIPLFRLRYSLNTSSLEMRQLAIDWEREVFRYIKEEFKSELIELSPLTSTAISDVITKTAHDEGLYMMIMFLIFFILLGIFISIQGNFHTSVGYLPLCGILSIGLSTGATFGLISIFHIRIIEPMALLVFIVTIIECMRFSIVCGEYHRIITEHLIAVTDTSSEINIEKILPSIIESTHPYFIVSTLIISIVYSLFSICSPLSSTMPICLTLVLYIFLNYIVHSTFFSSCLVITIKRVSSRRHGLFCYRLSKDYYTKTNREFNKLKLLKTKIRSLLNIDSIWKKLFTSILSLLFIVFITLSMWFGLSIDTCLYDNKFLPHNAYSLRSHMQSQADDFDMGPMIMFTIPEETNYENEQVQLAMRFLLKQCVNETRTNTFKLLWLDYENINSIITGHDPLEFRITPFSRNDLIVSEGQDYSKIVASRFYCQYKSVKGDREDIRTMNQMYTYANQNPIRSIFPYSLVFPNYESLGQLRIEMCLLIFALIICSFITTFILFISLKNSLLIISHLLALLAGSLTCLYLFHNLTFNFVNASWLYVVPILFIDTLIHVCYNQQNSKWKYNRVIISLIISTLILYLFPIQTYIFKIIISSIIYQSIICFILINLILPSWFYLFQSNNDNNNNKDNNINNDQIDTVTNPAMTIIVGSQSLPNGVEMNNPVNESNGNINHPI